MKRFVIFFCAVALLAGLCLSAPAAAEEDHPITLTVTCDPEPELEGDGVIPNLLFTIRNTGDTDYTLENAVLTGGYENAERILTETITVLAGGTKEFHLNDVPVLDAQLDQTVTYVLSWEENESVEDEETGDFTSVTHKREAAASILLPRFVVPELSVSASCEKTSVRADEPFEVVYTIRNDTAFDMTSLRLYDPEQSMQSIQLPDSDLSAGDSIEVRVEYRMGASDMTFDPRIEYIVRRREMETHAENALTVVSVVVNLAIETEMHPATAEGTTFAVTIRNNGSHTVTNICLYDEINTLLSEPFDLPAEGYKTVLYTVMPAVSSDRVRTVRFHVKAVDPMDQPISIQDPQEYSVVPYIMPDSVQLGLSAILKSPYYNEDGKLCASIQFVISNSGEVKIFNAVLKEITLFGDVKTYDELRHGDTYYTQIYQLDGVKELKFRVEAVDPAGVPRSSDIVRLDLSGLKELADRKSEPQHVYTQNAYFQDIDQKYGGVLRIAAIIGLSVAAVCAIVCIVLYAVEIRIRNKLPAEFEDEMERTLRKTKRRAEKQLFSDAPTEQFGYTAPIKLRNYGELTEEEAKARRALYEKGMRENMKRAGVRPTDTAKQKPEPVRIDADGTRVIPVVKRTAEQPIPEQAKPKAPKTPDPAESSGTRAIPVVKRPAEQPIPVVPRTVQTAPNKPEEPENDRPNAIPVVPRTVQMAPNKPEEPENDRPTAIPVVPRKTAAEPRSPQTDAEPIRIYEPKRAAVRPAEPEEKPVFVPQRIEKDTPVRPAEPEEKPVFVPQRIAKDTPIRPAEPEEKPAFVPQRIAKDTPVRSAEPEEKPVFVPQRIAKDTPVCPAEPEETPVFEPQRIEKDTPARPTEPEETPVFEPQRIAKDTPARPAEPEETPVFEPQRIEKDTPARPKEPEEAPVFEPQRRERGGRQVVRTVWRTDDLLDPEPEAKQPSSAASETNDVSACEVVPDAPPQPDPDATAPEPEPDEIIETVPDTEPDYNASDVVIPDTAPDSIEHPSSEQTPDTLPACDVVPDASPMPESDAAASYTTETDTIPACGVVPDAPPQPEPDAIVDPVPDPEPVAADGISEAAPVSASIHRPRKFNEKPTPARRAVVLHPIKRMEHGTL